MKRKILILSGSPRRGGNTEELVKAFAKGAESAGHEVNVVDCGQKKLKPCIACDACFSKGEACVFDSEFSGMAHFFEECDTLVLASPLYWFNFSSQIKMAIDKMYSLLIGEREMKVKNCALLVCGESDDDTDYEGIIRTYELISNYREWKDLGHVIAKDVCKKGDILKTDYLQEAEKLGNTI